MRKEEEEEKTNIRSYVRLEIPYRAAAAGAACVRGAWRPSRLNNYS